MMGALVLVALAALALLTPQAGLAAMRPAGEDVFGMYANNNFNGDPSDENPPYIDPAFGQVQAYIYLTNVTAPDIGGFEFTLTFDDPAGIIVWSSGLPAESTNFAEAPMYIVGLGNPLLPDQYGNVILMSPEFFVTVTTPILTSVGPSVPATVPDQMTYVEYFQPVNQHAMNPASGNFVDPIFAFSDVIVENEGTTWSDVKSMYR
jgi:hypothetical protein